MISSVLSTELRHRTAPGDQEEVGFTLAVSVGVGQVKVVKLKPDLADVIVEPIDHQVADALSCRRVGEVGSILRGGGATIKLDWTKVWEK